MFSKAIVRTPAKSMVEGITSNPQLGRPDYGMALEQHAAYVKALERCGLAVEVLPADERYPDSCFIEDAAVCTRAFAMVTRPGAASRRGEVEGMTELLSLHYEKVERIREPGSLEGGDVMMVRDHFYIGLSERTNAEGAAQLIAALERHGLSGSTVTMSELLHLKTGLSYLEDGILLVAGEFIVRPEFKDFTKLEIDPAEAYAANCIRVNDSVLVPSGYPRTAAAIGAAGLRVIELDTSEFRKLDGGLSCLSLRF